MCRVADKLVVQSFTAEVAFCWDRNKVGQTLAILEDLSKWVDEQTVGRKWKKHRRQRRMEGGRGNIEQVVTKLQIK